ncbi:CDP-glycerol glycerophosphotransferase family protein [Vagococcus fluvialis]|uniref:CDP-glycerol glycerophosphotransferase family protein n=1 Tax=Vagococcus fluvialis TaxID=2738 RepID=UPI003B58FC7D
MKHKILKQFFNTLYHFFSLFYSNKGKKVVFYSNRSETLSRNLTNLMKEFEKETDYEIKVKSFNFKRSIVGRFIYFFQSVQSMYELATADLFIIDDYFLPVYYIENKQERNKVVQVWHAIGHLKKYGLSIEKNRQSTIKHHSNYDFVVANAPGDVKAILSSFDVTNDKVHVLGAPRLDDLIIGEQKKINKKNIFMYAPTYRDASNEDKVYSYINQLIEIFITRVDQENNYLYLSLHPYLKIEKINLRRAKNIEIFKDGNKSSKLLKEVDVLITDYSSILLDYAYFEKPILIYAPDYQEYIQNTGFFVDYKEYIGTTFYEKAEDVIEALLDFEQIELDYVLKLKEDNFYYKDGRNSARVFQALNEWIK